MSLKGSSRNFSAEEPYTYTNFWGIDGYKNTVKRLEDGATLCDEFMKMVQERAEIEMKYTLKLREWSKRWHEKMSGKISEYGTMLEVFKAALREAEGVAQIHAERHNGLKANLCESIKQWKNHNYHKSVLKWKEVKECESGFAKIYEPWARRYHKMDKAKKNFHLAAKNSEKTLNSLKLAEKDGSTPDKVKKLHDQDSKQKNELEDARKKYERRLSEMNANNDTYAVELEAEFIKWERFEKVRLDFFKDALQRYHNVQDISRNERLGNIYQSLQNKVQSADSTKDLKWWSNQHGPGMPKRWPEFEEPDVWNVSYSGKPAKKSLIRRLSLRRRASKRRRKPDVTVTTPTRTHITSRRRSSALEDSFSDDSFSGSTEWSGQDGVLSNRTQQPGEDPRSSYYQSPSHALNATSAGDPHHKSPNIDDYYNDAWNENSTFASFSQDQAKAHSVFEQPSEIHHYSTPGSNSAHVEYDPDGSQNTKLASGVVGVVNHDDIDAPDTTPEETGSGYNPFDEDGDVEDESFPTEPAKVNGDVHERQIAEDSQESTGIPVRAKYDYEASEDDELSFHTGDIITQLSGEDGQGWCKGRLNGVEGLFPAKWVEAV